ncbi:VOC family protein [Pseudalkalibacillus decolorationis]|uniref:VOC family protein n=1 Tax=Pseudalkalibacillus decolorationis TaxID=163879 RepID=UPI0021490E94|nr:VOC family protein [Pseudalkalibacillus decolorationis]
MANDFWINLPVKDLNQSKEFFREVGFTVNPQGESVQISIGNTNVMLFPESTFKEFAGNEIADPKQASEVLFSVGAGSREEVDELVQKAANAGGTIYSEPRESYGWMYGAGFIDLDGHRWNVLFMDMTKMPKQ